MQLVRVGLAVLVLATACGGGGNLGMMEQDFPCDFEGRCPGTLVCSETRQCVPGAPACEAPKAICGTDCVNLMTSEAHCGACDKACRGTEQCTAGVCKPPMSLGCQFGCFGGATCVNGECACPGQNATYCSAICADLTQSTISCGVCLDFCSVGGQICRQGTCQCPPGEKVCGTGSAQTCEATNTDPTNCGTCGNTCPAGQKCEAGTCVAACSQNTGACSTKNCWDLQTDPLHCGATCTRCGEGARCTAGLCACPAGATLCSSDCRDLQNDPVNCGTCGNRCAGGQVCTAGVCGCPPTAPGCTPMCGDKKTCGAGEQCVGGECQQAIPAVGCTACPCDFCDVKKNWLCCTRPAGVFCQEGTYCP